MGRIFPYLAGLALVVGSGLVHGWWTERWQDSTDLRAAVARLEHLPGDLGPWKQRPAKLDPEAERQAGAAGSWVREYTHETSGNSVLVILLCGRPGPISVHRPEDCYRGAGFELTAPPFPYALRSARPRLLMRCWCAKFRRQDKADPTRLRILWSWFAQGAWQAPESPRLAFAGRQALYKLYVVREMTNGQERLEEDPCLDLLRWLLPPLTRTLSPP
jgi:hypothetical protein